MTDNNGKIITVTPEDSERAVDDNENVVMSSSSRKRGTNDAIMVNTTGVVPSAKKRRRNVSKVTPQTDGMNFRSMQASMELYCKRNGVRGVLVLSNEHNNTGKSLKFGQRVVVSSNAGVVLPSDIKQLLDSVSTLTSRSLCNEEALEECDREDWRLAVEVMLNQESMSRHVNERKRVLSKMGAIHFQGDRRQSWLDEFGAPEKAFRNWNLGELKRVYRQILVNRGVLNDVHVVLRPRAKFWNPFSSQFGSEARWMEDVFKSQNDRDQDVAPLVILVGSADAVREKYDSLRELIVVLHYDAEKDEVCTSARDDKPCASSGVSAWKEKGQHVAGSNEKGILWINNVSENGLTTADEQLCAAFADVPWRYAGWIVIGTHSSSPAFLQSGAHVECARVVQV